LDIYLLFGDKKYLKLLQTRQKKNGLFGIILLKKKENGKNVLVVMKLNLLILIFLQKIKPQKMAGIACVNVVEIKKINKDKSFEFIIKFFKL